MRAALSGEAPGALQAPVCSVLQVPSIPGDTHSDIPLTEGGSCCFIQRKATLGAVTSAPSTDLHFLIQPRAGKVVQTASSRGARGEMVVPTRPPLVSPTRPLIRGPGLRELGALGRGHGGLASTCRWPVRASRLSSGDRVASLPSPWPDLRGARILCDLGVLAGSPPRAASCSWALGASAPGGRPASPRPGFHLPHPGLTWRRPRSCDHSCQTRPDSSGRLLLGFPEDRRAGSHRLGPAKSPRLPPTLRGPTPCSAAASASAWPRVRLSGRAVLCASAPPGFLSR